MSTTKRYMFRTAVKKEKLELYKTHHQMVWEAVEVGLRNSGVSLLTIWGDKEGGNILQMYIEIEVGKNYQILQAPELMVMYQNGKS